jgi:hypothetical protein
MLKPNDQPTPVPPEGEPAAGPPEPIPDPLPTLTRLLVGGAVIGLDELLSRSGHLQTEISQAIAQKMAIGPHADLERNRRYLMVIGLLFETPEALSSGLSKVGQVTGSAAGAVGKVLGPIYNSRLARPIKKRCDNLLARGEATAERWTERGRGEEQVSRALTEQVVDELIQDIAIEVMTRLAQKPEVREMVQQQSVSLAGEVVGQVRQGTASTDAFLERLARALIRRAQHEAVIDLPASSIVNGAPK